MSDVYAPPQSQLEELEKFELASRGSRLGAAIIDGIINMLTVIPLMMALGMWEMVIGGEEPGLMFTVGVGLASFVLFALIHGYFLATGGQTIGKKILGIRMVDMQDQILPVPSILGKRYLPITLVSMIPLIGQILPMIDILFIFRKDRRCIHDLIAGTKVVLA